ncbi:hypothetical protein, conserved [Eimeria brunetti]|uniref:Uncharacterized protein n=1 Tax=Eimeria brunetti TaxID=51314 RepID=U6LH19_9EIME|nr:hypothetical protein, conserved [Eimeria brunetti]
MPRSRVVGGPDPVGVQQQQQQQARRQHNGTTGDVTCLPYRLPNAVLCEVQTAAGAAVAVAAPGTPASAVAVDGCAKSEFRICMNSSLPMNGSDRLDAAEAAGKNEAECATALGCVAAVGAAGAGPAVAAIRAASGQPICRVHGVSRGIASEQPRGAEASVSPACNTAAADAAKIASAAAAVPLRESEDARILNAFSFCASSVAVGGDETEHNPSTSAVEAARWGSWIPRMPVALREGFLAEVKSLQKKPIMKITTSVEGAYGESSVSSLFKLFSLLNKHYGLNEHSTFLDIGRLMVLLSVLNHFGDMMLQACGSGVPSLAAAAFGCTFTLGLELDSNVYSISVINHFLCQPVGTSPSGTGQPDSSLAPRGHGQLDASASAAVVAAAAGAGHAERHLLETTFGFNASFCVFDCSRLSSLEGISHVFSFDLAMPPWVMAHTVRLFNQSKTTSVFVSFHGDLISSFGMQAVLASRLSMRMGTSAESHVGFIYQKIPKKEAQHQCQSRRELQGIKQPLVTAAEPDDAAADSSVEGTKHMQRRQLQWQLALLQEQLGELEHQQQEQRRYPSKLQRQRQDLLRALETTTQESLQMLQLMLQHQQQGLLLQQQLQVVALLQQDHGEGGASQEKLTEGTVRLLEQQYLQEHHELAQRLSLQYWTENERQQTLLKEATEAVAVGKFPETAAGRTSALGSKVQQVRRELREKQKQLQNLDLMQRREEREQRRLEQNQQQIELLPHPKSRLEGRCFECNNRLLETAQQHARDVQQKQRQQLLLLKGIASSRTDKILHSIAAAGRLQQMAQIFVAAVSILPNPVSRRKEAITEQQQQKLPCCCSGCCYPLYRGSSAQPAAAAAHVELMSAAHPQQQLLLLRRVFSAFQVDQLLERGSLMQEPEQQAIIAARAEALLAHLRDISVQGLGNQTLTTPAGTATGKENAAGPWGRGAALLPRAATAEAEEIMSPHQAAWTINRFNGSCIDDITGDRIASWAPPHDARQQRENFPLAVQQQLLQQEVFMQQRIPLITVIDKQEQQQLEQQCMKDWKAVKAASVEPSSLSDAGAQAQAVFKRGMVACPFADAFEALQLLQQKLQEDSSQPGQAEQGSSPGVAVETKCLEAAFLWHFEKLLEVHQHKVHLRGSLFSGQQVRAPGPAVEAVVGDGGEDDATRLKETTPAFVSPTSCKEGFQRQPKKPRRSPQYSASSESFDAAADAVLPTARDYPAAAGGTDGSSACSSERRVPCSAIEDVEASNTAVQIRLHSHEARLLHACAAAAVEPTMRSCKRALELLLQQRRLLEQHEREGNSVNCVSVGPSALIECKWMSKTAPGLQAKSSATTWSVPSDSDCCSTHSSRSTCTSHSSKETAARRLALVAVAGEQLQRLRRYLVQVQTTLRQKLLLQILQRDFPDYRATVATAAAAATDSMDEGALPATHSNCSCAPQLHLEQQEALFQGGRGSCIWWRQYYMLLGEIAILKEKALYKAVDICLQQQQQPASQELPGEPQQLEQQQLQRPRGGQVKGTSASVNKTVVAEAEGPSILKGSGMGSRLSDPLLQSPLAPRKRRSQGGF